MWLAAVVIGTLTVDRFSFFFFFFFFLKFYHNVRKSTFTSSENSDHPLHSYNLISLNFLLEESFYHIRQRPAKQSGSLRTDYVKGTFPIVAVHFYGLKLFSRSLHTLQTFVTVFQSNHFIHLFGICISSKTKYELFCGLIKFKRKSHQFILSKYLI